MAKKQKVKSNVKSNQPVLANSLLKQLLVVVLILVVVVLGYLLYQQAQTVHGCVDSDGRNYYRAGAVQFQRDRFADSCVDSSSVKEYFCAENVTREETRYCEFGCYQGTCRERTILCGGKHKVACPGRYACDYANATYFSEVGTCVKDAEVTTPIRDARLSNTTYQCYFRDGTGDTRSYFIKKGIIFYVTNQHYQKVLAQSGVYLNHAQNLTWSLRLYESLNTSEYMSTLQAIREGKNALGPIPCRIVGVTPVYFQEFIDNHPFLYSALKNSTDISTKTST